MSIFDLLGAAGAGYTRGLAGGEQAKIQLLRQQQQDQLRQDQHGLQRDQLDLQRMKLLKDSERALSESRDRIREMYMKAGVEAAGFLRDQQNRADLSAQGVDVFGSEAALQEFLQKIADPNADVSKLKFPFPQVLRKTMEREMGGQAQQPGRVPPPLTNQPTQIAPTPTENYLGQQNIPDVGGGQFNLGGGTELIRALQGQTDQPGIPQGKEIVETPRPIPTIPQPPKTAAEIDLKKKQSYKAETGAALDESRIQKIDEELKTLADEKKALISQRLASAAQSNAIAGAIPGREDRADAVAAETARKNKEQEKIEREKLARQKAVDSVEANYKRAQTKKTLADWQKIKNSLGAVSKSVKLDPVDAAELKFLQDNATTTSKITGKVQKVPGYNERFEKFLGTLRTKYKSQLPGAVEVQATSETTTTLPGKLDEFFEDDRAEVKAHLKDFDKWVNTLSPEAQETARAIRALMR
jgi:hypothetical protein